MSIMLNLACPYCNKINFANLSDYGFSGGDDIRISLGGYSLDTVKYSVTAVFIVCSNKECQELIIRGGLFEVTSYTDCRDDISRVCSYNWSIKPYQDNKKITDSISKEYLKIIESRIIIIIN